MKENLTIGNKILTAKVGEYLLLDSISLIQFDENPVTLNIHDPAEQDMVLDIVFRTERSHSESYTEIYPDSDTHATMTIVNTVDGCNGTLLHLGFYNKTDNLYLNYAVTTMGKSRQLLINLYTKKI